MSGLHDTLLELGALAGVDVAKMAPRTKAAAKPRAKAAPKPRATKPKAPRAKVTRPKGGQGRRDSGKRGTTGTQLPASAGNPHPRDSPAWHAANRATLQRQKQRVVATHAERRQAKYPKVNHGGFSCTNCGGSMWHEHRVATSEGKHHATLAFKGCHTCGTMHASRVGVSKDHVDDLTVVKVDSTETAVQRRDEPGGITDLVGHRRNCPRGGSSPCGKAVQGKCTTCGANVRDHEALGKD